MDQGRFVGQGHFDREGIEAGLARDPRLVHAAATTTEMAIDAASHTGRRDIVGVLLERGAPYSMSTAVLVASPKEVSTMLDLWPERLHERGAHDFPLAWYAVIRGSLDMMEFLLQRGLDVEAQHHLGTTALHWAARAGDGEMVALLLECGANPRRRGRKFGPVPKTPAHLAQEKGHGHVVRLLRNRGDRAR